MHAVNGTWRRFALPAQPQPTIDALVLAPEAADRPLPLILSLHGAGQKGGDAQRVADDALPRHIAEAGQPPAVVVCPHCPERSGWPVAALLALLDRCLVELPVDPDRVIATGASMGGRGVYELAYDHADRFAALVPICAFGIPTLAPRLARVPLWIVHGEDDAVVPIARGREMADALVAAGAAVRFVALPGVAHAATARHAYADPALWRWMLAASRGSRC